MGVRIAQKAASKVDLLVVAERDQEKEARRMSKSAAADFEAAGIPVTIHQRTGRMADEIVGQAQATSYDLVVIGSRGRRGVMRLLLGSVALHVTGHAPASVLVVKGRARDLKQFLVCSSAGPASERTIQFAGRLAQTLDASAEELIQRGSREGVHLSRMLGLLATEGRTARVAVRHGLVRDKIIAEVREGRYDLLVTGAHVTPGLNARLADDLSADILLAANCPVLIVR